MTVHCRPKAHDVHDVTSNPGSSTAFVATCSLWESARAVSTCAYKSDNGAHPAAIAAGRARPFDYQSAFIRFRPYPADGHLDGKNPLHEHGSTVA